MSEATHYSCGDEMFQHFQDWVQSRCDLERSTGRVFLAAYRKAVRIIE